MRRMIATSLAVAWIAAACLPMQAVAGCTGRSQVGFGETAATIAQKCGITVEALERHNPGFDRERPRLGESINIPRPALPSPRLEIQGNRGIVAPAPPMTILGR